MNEQELAQLESKSEQLWDEVQSLWKLYIDKADQWRSASEIAKEQRSRMMVKQPT